MKLPIVLTDIEGTTSSISFVKDVLFPYARERLPRWVRERAADPAVRQWLDQTAREAGTAPGDDEAAIATLLAWIDEDRKATPLKALQGMIWAEGYAGESFVAHVYPDAVAQLRALARGRPSDLRLFLRLDPGAAALFRPHRRRRPAAAVQRLVRHHQRAQARERLLPAHRRGDRRGRRPTSCSCPTSRPNSTPRARPACAPGGCGATARAQRPGNGPHPQCATSTPSGSEPEVRRLPCRGGFSRDQAYRAQSALLQSRLCRSALCAR